MKNGVKASCDASNGNRAIDKLGLDKDSKEKWPG